MSVVVNRKTKVFNIKVDGLFNLELPNTVDEDYYVFIWSKTKRYFCYESKDRSIHKVRINKGIIQKLPYRANQYVFDQCSFHEGYDIHFPGNCDVDIIKSRFVGRCKFTGQIDQLIISAEQFENCGTIDLSSCQIKTLIIKNMPEVVKLPTSVVDMKLMSCPEWIIDVNQLPQLMNFQSDCKVRIPVV